MKGLTVLATFVRTFLLKEDTAIQGNIPHRNIRLQPSLFLIFASLTFWILQSEKSNSNFFLLKDTEFLSLVSPSQADHI